MKKILLLALATLMVTMSPCFGQVRKNTKSTAATHAKQYQKKESYTFDAAYPSYAYIDRLDNKTQGSYNVTIDKTRKVVLLTLNVRGKSLFTKEMKYNDVSGNISEGGIEYELQDGSLSVSWNGYYTIEIWGDFGPYFFGIAPDEGWIHIMFEKPTKVTGE